MTLSMLLAQTALLALTTPAATPHQPAAATPAAQARYSERQLSVEQARADVALLRRALETIHPGLYRYRSRTEIEAAFARLEAVASRPATDLVLWAAVAEMMAEIRCDHSKAEGSAGIERWREGHPTMLPFRFQLIEGRMIVVSSDGQPGAPPRGGEIVAVNGRPVPLVLDELARMVSYDGHTDQSVATKLASDSDLTGDDFNEFWPSLHGFAERWEIEWKRPGEARTTTASLASIDFPRWATLAWPGAPYRAEFYNATRWRLAGRTAYLRIDTFVNYRNPVDAPALLSGFFRTLGERGTQHLILDLRNNGGGSRDASLALARYLMPEPFVWQRPTWLKAVRYGDLPEHIYSWGDRDAVFAPPLTDFRRTADGWWERIPNRDNPDDEGAFEIAAAPDRFAGRVTILGGPANASGATWTIAKLREAGVRLVGQDTGGSAEGPTSGHIFLLTLPNSGLKVRIASAWNRAAVDRFVPGEGVAADEIVLPTLADFEASRDRALDVAKAEGDPPAAPGVADLLAGRWHGTLDYRDFGTDRRVVLPVTADHALEGGGVTVAAAFDDGPGNTVRQRTVWALTQDQRVLLVGDDRFRIVERRASADRRLLTLVAYGTGEENGLRVDVQLSVVRDGGRLSITRATRRGTAPFLLRHSYRLEEIGRSGG